MSEILLQTKLFTPPLRPSLVPRSRLMDQLNDGSVQKLILVSAPAGFGKTTLVVHWLNQQALQAAWLSLDENDNTTRRFFIYLLTAIQSIYPELGRDLSASLQAPNPPKDEAIMTALVNELATHTESLILVLDDFHVIENPIIQEAVAFLIDFMPPSIHLIITSRVDPPLPLPRWRVRGQLTEIRDVDLRFTDKETASFLTDTMGLQLEQTAVSTLEARTEGWVAGLQLAAISLRNHKNRHTFINEFSGSQRQVADYLLQEVLLQRPAATQQFLLKSSILERFNADLCDYLLDQDNSRDILEELEQANLFLIPLDNQQYWYRFHHLFVQLLSFRLDRDVPATAVAQLQRRAAQWYESQGLLEEAIGHALASPDFDYAAHLISSIPASIIFEQGEIGLIKQWVRKLPTEILTQQPRAAVLAIGAHMITADFAETRHYLDLIADNELVRPEYNLFQSILIRNDHSDFDEALALAQGSYDALKGREYTLAATALMQVAVNYINLGQLSAGEEKLHEMRRLLEPADKTLNMTLQAIHLLATSAQARADYFRAEQFCRDAEELAAGSERGTPPMIGWIYAKLADIYYEWNELEKATGYVEQALDWGERTGISDILIHSKLAKANLACVAGDVETVLGITDSLQSQLKSSHLQDMITLSEVLTAWYHLQLGDLTSAVRWANASGFNLEDKPAYRKIYIYQVVASIRLAESRELGEKRILPRILELIEHIVQLLSATADDRMALIRLLALKSLVLDWNEESAGALKTLDSALSLAEPGSLIRLFLDEGAPMQRLLSKAISLNPTYVSRLLRAFPEETTAVGLPAATAEPAIYLTERETDVLQAIAAGLSNKEIEQSLFISNNTVRTHIKNLYSKLDVESRTQAIVKASELNLLSLRSGRPVGPSGRDGGR